jgi:hypothetical protein
MHCRLTVAPVGGFAARKEDGLRTAVGRCPRHVTPAGILRRRARLILEVVRVEARRQLLERAGRVRVGIAQRPRRSSSSGVSDSTRGTRTAPNDAPSTDAQPGNFRVIMFGTAADSSSYLSPIDAELSIMKRMSTLSTASLWTTAMKFVCVTGLAFVTDGRGSSP